MQQARRKNPYLGPIIVIGTLGVLLLILIMAIAIFFTTRQVRQSSSPNPLIGPNPMAQLDVNNIDPALALASLGGAPEVDVMAEAIDKARPDVALAALLFQPTLSNKEGSGGFLQLAGLYAKNGDKDKAVFSYQMAAIIAVLAPDLPDTVRADLFLQSSEGLIELREAALAKFYLDQAFVVALNSPTLQAAHRRAIFEGLHKNYLALEERSLARQSLNLSANPPGATAAENQTVLPKSRPVPLPAAIQEAEAARWRAAQELAVILVERGGSAPQLYVDTLAEALVAEDELKSPFYEGEFGETSFLSTRIDLTTAQINWLSLKYRMARRAYGLSITPEWEAQADQIRTDLIKKYETLFALYADLAIALPEVSQIDRATEERLRIEILAGELGRYPNYPEEQRQKQLLDATRQLIATQPEIKIFVTVSEVNNQEMYRLISLEQNGQ